MAARRFVPIKLSEEDRLQRAIVDHWRARGAPGTVLAAIPNGGARAISTAARLKLTGTLAGMPDLLCLKGGEAFFIELKKPGGRLSPAQKERIPQIEEAGITVYVIDDLDEALRLLEVRGVLKGSGAARAA